MQSSRRGTDRANTRLYSLDRLPPVRTKKRHVPRLEPLEERTLLLTYNIGPGQPYTTLGSFPWSSLGPGDTVDIHWQPTPYYEKLLISESGTASAPINIVGVPGPSGQQPIIDGQNATTSSQFQYFYNPVQENALVMIQRSASQSRSYAPSYINISGLELRNAYQAYNFTDNTGKTQTYSSFAASLCIEGASNITIQNCTLDSSGLGLFALTNDSTSLMTSNVMVEGNYFYNNGVPGSYLEHNSYCEVNGITYQYNEYGPLRSGSAGAELKDRSAGTVIRDNYFSPAAAILDLVDAEDSNYLESLPSYTNTYVYGNIFDNTGANQTGILVHFGGDSGGTSGYRPNLYFYDNTVVNVANQSNAWRTFMFHLDTTGQTVYAANNIFYNEAATPGQSPSLFEFSGNTGNINFSPTNWVSPGWLTSESAEMGTAYDGTISGTNTFFVDPNNNPSFVNLSGGNYQLASGSNAIGIAGSLNPSWPAVTEQYVAATSGTARTSVADIGAYQAGVQPPPPVTQPPPPVTQPPPPVTQPPPPVTQPPPPVTQKSSIWSSSASPQNANENDSHPVEVGVRFSSDVDGYITGLKFYKGSGNTGIHVGHLWDSAGNLLATATFTSETATGWQQVNFSTPVAITAGTTYVASYLAPNGHYADDQNYLTSQYNSGSLHVPANGGVYAYGGASTFPTQVWNASNYWVDVVFTTTL